jgi:hypothetical protein
MAAALRAEVPIQRLEVAAYTLLTDRRESDGTLEWDSTTIVAADVAAGGARGLGYTYADASAAQLIERRLRPVVEGIDAMAVARFDADAHPRSAQSWAAKHHRLLAVVGLAVVGAAARSAISIFRGGRR